jgi:hypothetical protein
MLRSGQVGCASPTNHTTQLAGQGYAHLVQVSLPRPELTQGIKTAEGKDTRRERPRSKSRAGKTNDSSCVGEASNGIWKSEWSVLNFKGRDGNGHPAADRDLIPHAVPYALSACHLASIGAELMSPTHLDIQVL